MSPRRFIKICGLTNADDAQSALGLGADLLGMVMHPKSPRFCSEENARKIIQDSYFTPTVLVFADNDIDYARQIIKNLAGELTFIQAPTKSGLFQWLRSNYPVRKTIPVYSVEESIPEPELQSSLGELAEYPWIILDTGGKKSSTGEVLFGGTGQTFNWESVSRITRNFFLAGGLNPGNVAEAIRVSGAGGYDVSSGIESSPGKKDFDKMRLFISIIRHSGEHKNPLT